MFNYPWDQAPDWANWAATDIEGDKGWYENEPQVSLNYFTLGFISSGKYLKFECGEKRFKDWKESKQARPK